VLSLVAIFLSGCATGKEAQEVARVNLAQTNTYEGLVQKKITAEKTYYNNSVSYLQKSLKVSQINADREIVGRASYDFQSTVSNRQQDLQAKDLRDFVDKTLGQVSQSRARYANAVTEYNEELLNSLTSLELQKQSLGKVRQGLEQLQAKSSDVVLFKEWFEFAKKVKEEYEKSAPSGTAK
jgi:phosphopentomutase